MMFCRAFCWRDACVVALLCTTLITASSIHDEGHPGQLGHQGNSQHVMRPTPPKRSFASIMEDLSKTSGPETTSDSQTHRRGTQRYFRELRNALNTMQDLYFSLWLGKWNTAIDWTAAVMGTHLSATLSSLSESAEHDRSPPHRNDDHKRNEVELENEINKFFSQSISSYFGEEAFSIRLQAYDDILWVVLEWLESMKFINRHSLKHDASEHSKGRHWHAQQFIPVFAHRARVFYELSEQGWDWRLCGGGMTWNPRLNPYKNAITNQLFISASVSMYLNWPGDSNCSPFLSTTTLDDDEDGCTTRGPRGPRDPIFLQNAINGYTWLQNSGMLNSAGLYTDGFHISDYRTNKSATECDDRNEMVYTYNQGVILSGLRDLWIATNNVSFLEFGHELINNVITATGYDNKWAGLGRNGILTEACDETGRCNQDGQTFKGIFFHHLTAFCRELPRRGEHGERSAHRLTCGMYAEWVQANADAAMRTRDAEGRFGGWWGAPQDDVLGVLDKGDDREGGKVDYRNWPERVRELGLVPEDGKEEVYGLKKKDAIQQNKEAVKGGDLNDRGRGRTLETQGSGLAVVRAAYEFR